MLSVADQITAEAHDEFWDDVEELRKLMNPTKEDLVSASNGSPAEHSSPEAPATPLPWQCSPVSQHLEQPGMWANIPIRSPWRENAWEGDAEAGQNMRYIAHACNAYPKLVAALQENAALWAYPSDIALLRELGELVSK